MTVLASLLMTGAAAAQNFFTYLRHAPLVKQPEAFSYAFSEAVASAVLQTGKLDKEFADGYRQKSINVLRKNDDSGIRMSLTCSPDDVSRGREARPCILVGYGSNEECQNVRGCALLYVHPAFLSDPQIKEAVYRSIEEPCRYIPLDSGHLLQCSGSRPVKAQVVTMDMERGVIQVKIAL